MPYLLRDGPRDGQLVDDLPRGYRAVGSGPPPGAPDLGDILLDGAVWAGDDAEPDES
ncbi:hypothetical protein [Microbacterium sp. SSM24]|uniref:hypothetical protein n=1 Tax=Microbacterium sp. SSM24 TaxID=2991714 RepID=UPI0022267804|nr:hypothetical protein [Microbacterium sp. SSM24]MCW3493209.1 hypothetical protein [Microbacterium sp. SSM24]